MSEYCTPLDGIAECCSMRAALNMVPSQKPYSYKGKRLLQCCTPIGTGCVPHLSGCTHPAPRTQVMHRTAAALVQHCSTERIAKQNNGLRALITERPCTSIQWSGLVALGSARQRPSSARTGRLRVAGLRAPPSVPALPAPSAYKPASLEPNPLFALAIPVHPRVAGTRFGCSYTPQPGRRYPTGAGAMGGLRA